MAEQQSKASLQQLYNQLWGILRQDISKDEILVRIAELGKQVISSHTFIITLLDVDIQEGSAVICKSSNPDVEEFLNQQKTSADLLMASTQDNLYSEIQHKFNLKSFYKCSLWSIDRLEMGCTYHLSDQVAPLATREKGLLESFASRVAVILENFGTFQENYSNNLEILCELPKGFITSTSENFLKSLPNIACQLLSASACILWKKDPEHRKFKILETAGKIDKGYCELELSENFELIQKYYQQNGLFSLSDTTKVPTTFLHRQEVERQGWRSMLSSPLVVEKEIIGILDVFREDIHIFTEIEIKQFECFSNYAALSFERATNKDAKKLEKLTEIMLNMINLTEIEDIQQCLLEGALELVSLGHESITSSDLIGEVSRLNYYTGELEIRKSNSNSNIQKIYDPLKLGKGFTGKALQERTIKRISDVLTPDARDIYVMHWETTRSEIAIPIYINNISIREETEPSLGSKLIGVLNIESPEIDTFAQTEEKYLELLSDYAAILMDRIEYNQKLAELSRKEQEIVNAETLDEIMEIVMDSILNILQFENVNISLVDFDNNRIQTKYIKSLRENKLLEEFKKEADHSLATLEGDTNIDIQAWVVKHKVTVVPKDPCDPRFDRKIRQKYVHENLIRVFIPMVLPLTSRVIGTLEAGYNRDFREHIYEQDIRVLENFVDYIVNVIQGTKSKLIDRITHEFRSPIVGIRSNASYLQRRREQLSEDLIDRKLDDILVDCDILLNQVAELEFTMKGRVSHKSRKKKTLVVRDVIIKTIRQLTPIILEHGLPIHNIDESLINPAWMSLRVMTDKVKLSQVIYNLLMNSIKYAKKDRNQFKIVIDIRDKSTNYVIKFRDWGIGIREQYKEDIFKEGFRCPEALNNYIAGSGLGLAISKSIMEELGGNLIISRLADPTEFHLILPKI